MGYIKRERQKRVDAATSEAFYDQKEYFHYSGYPGGLKRQVLKDVMEKSPEKVIYRAVRGMLATNRLRAKRMKRLKLVKGTAHTFKIDKQVNK